MRSSNKDRRDSDSQDPVRRDLDRRDSMKSPLNETRQDSQTAVEKRLMPFRQDSKPGAGQEDNTASIRATSPTWGNEFQGSDIYITSAR